MMRHWLELLFIFLFVPSHSVIEFVTAQTPVRLCAPVGFEEGGANRSPGPVGCLVESQSPPRKDRAGTPLKVASFNIEHGLEFEGIVKLFENDPRFRSVDILLLSEVDRFCSRTGNRNIAAELADQLEMGYVFGVESVQLGPSSRGEEEIVCEEGNAILSRVPFHSPRLIRHSETDQAFCLEARKEGRTCLGTRGAVAADLSWQGEELRVYSLHFSSDKSDNRRRGRQAAEIVADAADFSGPVLAGGDINSGQFLFDLSAGTSTDRAQATFRQAGFSDTHSGLALGERPTAAAFQGVELILDAIFSKGFQAEQSGVCRDEACNGLSDHLPIWTTLSRTLAP